MIKAKWPLLSLFVAAVMFGSQSANARAPDIDARAALVINADDGKILYSSEPNRKLAIASLTKLMTALLVLEQVPQEERITAASYKPQPAESKIDLRAGESMTVEDLLYALLLASANDAAVTFAQRLAGSTSAFVKEMNQKARKMGLKNTRFANPVGLDDKDNYSSAKDLAKLTRKLLKVKRFRQIVRSPEKTIKSGDRQRKLVNRNRLVAQHKFITGVKTGRTAASGYSLIGSGTKKGVDLVTVLLGAGSEESRDAGTLELFKYGFDRYKTVKAVQKGKQYGDVDIRFRDTEVALKADRSISIPVRRGLKVRIVSDYKKEVTKTDRGERLGTITVVVGGKKAASTDLVALRSVGSAGPLRKGVYYLAKPLGLIILLILLVGGGVAYRGIRLRK